MTIDERIDELGAACDDSIEPGAAVPWEEIERELGELRLPNDLRRFWERVDVTRLRDAPYPRPSTPAFALDGWRMLRDDPLGFPAGLFPWCYESHGHLLIELDAPAAAAGTVFEWGFGDSTIRLRYHDIGDWLAVAADVIRAGAVNDADRVRVAAAERLAARGPHPAYGTRTEFGIDAEDWPGHWRSIAELARREPAQRFPERTIADVLAARRAGPVAATVTATTQWLGATADTGTRLMLWDGTGHLDVWCPKEIRGHGLLGGMPSRMTIEIEATHWIGAEPLRRPWPFGDPVPDGALPPDRDALLAHLAPQATATIVHRT